MSFIGQELRSGLNKLRRKPGFTVLSVLILGLGIGVNVSIFSAVNAVLLRPLPYSNPDELVMLSERNLKADLPKGPVSPATYIDWTQQAGSFQQIGYSRSATYSLTGSGAAAQIQIIIEGQSSDGAGTPRLNGRS